MRARLLIREKTEYQGYQEEIKRLELKINSFSLSDRTSPSGHALNTNMLVSKKEK